jgi:two-component system sensor histidine kinase/response regulator
MKENVLMTPQELLKEENIASKVQELAFNALFKDLPIAFYWLDKDGYLLGANKLELEIFGISSLEHLIGKHSNELSSDPSAWKNSQQVIKDNETKTVEEMDLKPDGKQAYYLSIKTPIHDAEGNTVGVLGVSLDITERKRQEEELRIAKEVAETASKAKTQFLAVVSHELRTPLTGINGIANLLIKDELTPEQVKEYGKIILNSANYLTENVNGILDYAKLEANKMELTPTAIDLKEHIEGMISMLMASAVTKGLELYIDYEPDAPQRIISDSNALRHIIINLIGNALKFTEHGHVAVKVRCLEKTATSARLEIAVEDTGKGIPDDKYDFVFDRFSQVTDIEKRTSGEQGTGLGLSIVKKLTALLSGDIRLASKVGKGTTFYFTADFSLQDDAVKAMPWATHALNAKTLIADDSLRGDVIRRHLSPNNCHVVQGRRALSVLLTALQNKDPYRIVMIDDRLNNMSAADLLKTLREQKSINDLMPVLLVSDMSVNAKREAKENGFFTTILKTSPSIAFQGALTAAWEQWLEIQQIKSATFKKKILLVEDDAIVALAHTRLFTDLGCAIDVASNGTKALELAGAENNYDMIFSDVGLPDINGYEVIKTLRARENPLNKIPIIALTGYEGEDEQQSLLKAGANEVALKPIKIEALREILYRYNNYNDV